MTRVYLTAAVLILTPLAAICGRPSRWFTIQVTADGKATQTLLNAGRDALFTGRATPPSQDGNGEGRWIIRRVEGKDVYTIRSSVGRGYLAYDLGTADGTVFLKPEPGTGTTWSLTGPLDPDRTIVLTAAEGDWAGFQVGVEERETIASDQRRRVVEIVRLQRDPKHRLEISNIPDR